MLNKVFKKTQNLTKTLTNKNQNRIYKNHYLWLPWEPVNIRNEDIFLVSYPKSGNTYLRFLMANALKLYLDIEREINFFTLEEAIPSIRAKGGSNLRETGPFGQTNLPRIIKSHSAFNRKYKRIIFLTRDPRDTLNSYYYQVRNYQKRASDWSFSEFIRKPEFQPKIWADYTRSWCLNKADSDTNIQIFRYEDFMENPHDNLEKMMRLLGLSLEPEKIEKAIFLSAKENMKKLEVETASTYRVQANQTPFVRKGKAEQGQELKEEDRKYIEQETEEVAKSLGYNY